MLTSYFSGFRLSVLIRVVAVLLTIACIFVFNELAVMYLFIVLGLSHFTLAFWYQKGAGRWKPPAIGLLLIAFTMLALVVQATSVGWFFVLTGVYTMLHMGWDEIHLLQGKHSLFRTFEYFPSVLIYGGLLVDVNFGTSLFVESLSVTAVLLAVYGVLALLRRYRPDKISFVCLFWGLFALAVYVVSINVTSVPAYLWFLGLAVIHYFIWYGEYARKVANNPERRKKYYGRVLLVNSLFALGVLLFVAGFMPFGGILYMPTFFYIWSFLHVTTSTRLAELPAMVSFR